MADTYIITSEAEWLEYWSNIGEDWDTIDLAPVLTDQLTIMEEAHAGYFASASDPGGASWPPLSPATIAAKGHGTILIDTERLKGSLTEPGHPDAIRRVEKVGDGWEMVFGTDVEYSIWHDDVSGSRPARRHVGWDDPLIDRIVDNIGEAAVKEFTDA